MEKKVLSFIQYAVLIVFIGIAGITFSSLSDVWHRFIVIVVLAVFYFIWGLLHHKTLDRLTKPVVVEYLLVSIFTILIFAFGMGIIRFF